MEKFEKLFDAFESAGEELYFVGGFCRDLLNAKIKDDIRCRGNPHDDIHEVEFWEDVESGKGDVDFATSARPEKTIEILKKNSLKAIPIGIEFGTIQTILGNMKVEITTYRCAESYIKGDRKPLVKFGKDIGEDLERRDFTINAIAMSKDFKCIDPFKGRDCLVKGVLRTPLDAEISFTDDPLRILRAARFYARGFGSPSFAVGKAIKKLKKEIHTVSQERIFEEMTKMLLTPHPTLGLYFLQVGGILGELFPELEKVVAFKTKGKSKALWDHVLKVIDQTEYDPVQRWAALFHDVGKPSTVHDGKEVSFHGHESAGALMWENVAIRLKTSREFRDKVSTVIQESSNFTDLTNNRARDVTDKAIRRFVKKVGQENLENIYKFTLADMTTQNIEKRERMRTALKNLKVRMDKLIEDDKLLELKLPKGTGLLVCEVLDIKPGAELGEVMDRLNQMLVDGLLQPDEEDMRGAILAAKYVDFSKPTEEQVKRVKELADKHGW